MNSAGPNINIFRVGAVLIAAMFLPACFSAAQVYDDDEPSTAPRPSSGGRFAWPVRGIVVSVFGFRSGRQHAGLDISAREGTPIRASAAGVVTFSDGTSGGYGNMVLIDHSDGFVTAYAHNRDNLVSAGARVNQGDVIATVGATGNATGPHVHFEIRRRGRAVNPRPYLGR